MVIMFNLDFFYIYHFDSHNYNSIFIPILILYSFEMIYLFVSCNTIGILLYLNFLLTSFLGSK